MTICTVTPFYRGLRYDDQLQGNSSKEVEIRNLLERLPWYDNGTSGEYGVNGFQFVQLRVNANAMCVSSITFDRQHSTSEDPFFNKRNCI